MLLDFQVWTRMLRLDLDCHIYFKIIWKGGWACCRTTIVWLCHSQARIWGIPSCTYGKKNRKRDSSWLWNLGLTSLKVQKRHISGPTKGPNFPPESKLFIVISYWMFRVHFCRAFNAKFQERIIHSLKDRSLNCCHSQYWMLCFLPQDAEAHCFLCELMDCWQNRLQKLNILVFPFSSLNFSDELCIEKTRGA